MTQPHPNGFVAVGDSVGTETKIRKSQWPLSHVSLTSGISTRLPTSRSRFTQTLDILGLIDSRGLKHLPLIE
jgi:hypothetical protein